MSAQTYQVGAHFKALNEPVLVASSKILEKFFPFQLSQPPCVVGEVTSDPMLQNKVAKRFFNHFIYKSKENAQKSGIFKRFSCSSFKRNPKILNRFSLTSPIIEIFWENTFKFDSS